MSGPAAPRYVCHRCTGDWAGDGSDTAAHRAACPGYDTFCRMREKSDDTYGFKATHGLKHGPGGRGGPGPCDADCRKCAVENAVKAQQEAALRYLSQPHPTRAMFAGVDRTATPEKLSGAMLHERAGDLFYGDIRITADPTLRRDEIVMVQDPLDVEYDGVPLRTLVSLDAKARRENVTAQCARSVFTPAQRAAVSAHWSAELRAKVAASAAASAERNRRRILIDLEDDD